MKHFFLSFFFLTFVSSQMTQAIVWRGDVKSIETKAKDEMKQVGQVLFSPIQFMGGTCLALGGEWVMTCRHGTENWSAATLKVKFPALGKTVYAIEKIVICKEGDFALLKLKKRVRGAKKIALYEGDKEVGQRGWIGGFGLSGPVGKVGNPGTFYSGHNKVDKIRRGKLSISLSKPDDKSVEKDEATISLFDSGSPLLIKGKKGWELAGVASTATNGKNPGYGSRGNYARISKVVKWAKETMKK